MEVSQERLLRNAVCKTLEIAFLVSSSKEKFWFWPSFIIIQTIVCAYFKEILAACRFSELGKAFSNCRLRLFQISLPFKLFYHIGFVIEEYLPKMF